MTFEEWWAEQDREEDVGTRAVAERAWDRGATEALKMVFTGEPVDEEKVKAEAARQRRLL